MKTGWGRGLQHQFSFFKNNRPKIKISQFLNVLVRDGNINLLILYFGNYVATVKLIDCV